MTLNPEQRREYQRAIDEFRAKGGQVTRCNTHSQGTGNIRFNFATRKQREKEEREKAAEMERVRNGSAS